MDPLGLCASDKAGGNPRLGEILLSAGLVITQLDSPAPGPADIIGAGVVIVGLVTMALDKKPDINENTDQLGVTNPEPYPGRYLGDIQRDLNKSVPKSGGSFKPEDPQKNNKPKHPVLKFFMDIISSLKGSDAPVGPSQ